MVFEWKDFVCIARHLNTNGGATIPDEAAYRSAVNRAYYGAFGHSVSYAIKNFRFKPEGTGKDHKKIRELFKNKERECPGMAKIASNLEELHIWRKKCDYHNAVIDQHHPNQMALEAIGDAQEIVDTLL